MRRTTYEHWSLIERGLDEIEVLITYEVAGWGSAPYYGGRPEDYDPGEGPEYEITGFFIEAPCWAKGRYPSDLIPFAVTAAEAEALDDDLYANAEPEPDEGPDPDDWRDEMYERERYDEMDGDW